MAQRCAQGNIAVTYSCSGEQVDLSNEKCEADGCETFASFGYPGGRRVRCSLHRLTDMVRNAASEIINYSFHKQCIVHAVIGSLCNGAHAAQQVQL